MERAGTRPKGKTTRRILTNQKDALKYIETVLTRGRAEEIVVWDKRTERGLIEIYVTE
jgi:hypothetical protein